MTTDNIAVTPPAPPRGFTAALAPAHGSVKLTWSDPLPADSTITRWEYRKREGAAPYAGDSWTTLPGGGDAREVTVSGLKALTEYRFQARAVNSGGNAVTGEAIVNTRGIVVDPDHFNNLLPNTSTTTTVALSIRPAGDVAVRIDVIGDDDITASSTLLAFTPDNWNVPQTVTITVGATHGDEHEEARVTITAYSHAADYHGIQGVVTVNPRPVANAGDDREVKPGDRVTLIGSVSYPDIDQKTGLGLKYEWSQTGGTTVSLAGLSTSTVSVSTSTSVAFTAPSGNATLTFQLRGRYREPGTERPFGGGPIRRGHRDHHG